MEHTPLDGKNQVAAEQIFGDRLPLAQRYVEHLATSEAPSEISSCITAQFNT